MIGRLTGKVLECAPGQLLLDVAGVGYDVHIPLSTFYNLSSAGGAGTTASLHVHTHVREDALQLYGFSTREERAVFGQLISISGVGPRLALAVLSGIEVGELREAVWHQDRERLQKIPGVGKKTAERVLLELRDRMGAADTPAASGAGAAGGRRSQVETDAASALVNLGYAPSVAQRAIAAALDGEGGGGGASLESVLKSALRGLAR